MNQGLSLKWRLALIVGITIVLSHVFTFMWFMSERADSLERFARAQTENFAQEVVELYSRPGQAEQVAPPESPPPRGSGRDVLIVIAAPSPLGAPPGAAESYRPIEVVRPLPEGGTVRLVTNLERSSPWRRIGYALPTIVISLGAMALCFYGMVFALRPLDRLTAAADRLGVTFDAPPVPEDRGAPEFRRASQAFNRMRERLRGFIRERTQMLAAIGHDLRTPLTKLRLRMEFVEDAEIRAAALSDIGNMERLIGEFTAFAKEAAQPSGPVALDLMAMLADVQDDVDIDGGKVTIAGPAELALTTREVPLRRALTNVLANAVAYGGCARVEVQLLDRSVRILVDDDGPGIPPADRERVFEPFVRLEASRNREHGGTGLGLAITRDALRALGGTVALADAPGGGLRVVIELPLVHGAGAGLPV
jgi:signal transduction histidine kinase